MLICFCYVVTRRNSLLGLMIALSVTYCAKDTAVLTDDAQSEVQENPFAGFDFSNVDIFSIADTPIPDTTGVLGSDSAIGSKDMAGGIRDTSGNIAETALTDGETSTDTGETIRPVFPETCADDPTGVGCPCGSGGECGSGVCLPSAMGNVCAGDCGTGCPEGFVCTQLPDEVCPGCAPLCIPNVPFLCKPCLDDSECQAPFGDGTERCAGLNTEGSFCGIGCIPNGPPCPTGYTCHETTTVFGEPTFQCQPTTGICTCSPLAVEETAKTGCSAEVGSNPCPGLRTCLVTGLSACVPTPSEVEVCDGADNNCNGETDEGTCPANQACFCTQAGCGCDCDPKQTDCNPICVPGQTQPCDGECGAGVRPCVDNDWGECDAPKAILCMDYAACQQKPQCVAACPAAPAEQCNGKDDNCNSSVDEGFACLSGQQDSVACTGQCGTKSRTCTASCAWGEWSGCSGGPCVPGQTETQTQACGNCGKQSRTRTCETGCTWGAWGAWGGCGSQGVCSPNTKQPCPDCQEQVCLSNCTWSACQLKAGAACVWKNGTNYQCCGKGKWQFCSKECQWFPCANCAGAPYYCDTNCP
ncbi:MAG: hypothetical protein HUU55_01525 [Myxococcales bacterium]|nr:hypothetical protein [Myxococcales bacterium]